ncbi:hypothetical protein CEXT_740971 [Caerostris extrusa]|uniref:Uncharacterized protein n=1 Tax=Caerostris extrusa TaxID=172846 RepID=A0AAV4XPS9_CAEEX|nr:hypothetical protein CEXT_740971 [Caerostris extrusa]
MSAKRFSCHFKKTVHSYHVYRPSVGVLTGTLLQRSESTNESDLMSSWRMRLAFSAENKKLFPQAEGWKCPVAFERISKRSLAAADKVNYVANFESSALIKWGSAKYSSAGDRLQYMLFHF